MCFVIDLNSFDPFYKTNPQNGVLSTNPQNGVLSTNPVSPRVVRVILSESTRSPWNAQ